MMSKAVFIFSLIRIKACAESTAWVVASPQSVEELWRHCGRGDWLLWLVRELGFDDDEDFFELDLDGNSLDNMARWGADDLKELADSIREGVAFEDMIEELRRSA